ncbi:MAG TPA: L-2-hydroxyglutarate oxidase [Pirellulaceae bacterium]|nr:L-2-hydroxyglutarate oxidase [Pirellulaceae bacterium]
MNACDTLIVGGGIVGLAIAYDLTSRYPDQRVVVLEKEKQVAEHQTGHNSGVLHSGIYYKPGTLRATNCRAGKQAMERFCAEHGLPYEICGKVIVAVDEKELPLLENIYQRGQQNGVVCAKIGVERLKEIEPHAAGIAAVHVPEAGIVNYRRVAEKLAELLVARGGQVLTDTRFLKLHREPQGVIVETSRGDFQAKHVVTSAGLQADRVAAHTGHKLAAQILPFRGEYFELVPNMEHLCRHLIYPVPNPSFPFLGVHFTRMIDGGIECGPNAVLAFAREGYRKTDVNLRDLFEALSYRGFRRLAWKYWPIGLGEMWRSFSKAAFVKALQRLMPEIRSEHLVPARAGVRAQAVTPGGELADDFLIEQSDRVINIGNAPSPAATSSLNIGKLVVDRLEPLLRS